MLNMFISRSDSTVWADAINSPLISETRDEVRNFWTNYRQQVVQSIDFASEYELVKQTRANMHKEISTMWRDWPSVESNISLDDTTIDCCATVSEAQAGIKSVKKVVDASNTMLHVASLMCCDQPYQTAEFLCRCYFDRQGVSFGKQQELVPRMMKYVSTMLASMFVGKTMLNVGRPVHFEMQVLKYAPEAKTVQLIPHPNHGSLGGGHPTVGYAVLKAMETIAEQEIDADFKQGCLEVGESRVALGIHWHADLTAAYDMVESLHDSVMKQCL